MLFILNVPESTSLHWSKKRNNSKEIRKQNLKYPIFQRGAATAVRYLLRSKGWRFQAICKKEAPITDFKRGKDMTPNSCAKKKETGVTSTSQHQIFDEKFDQGPESVRIKMADLAGR